MNTQTAPGKICIPHIQDVPREFIDDAMTLPFRPEETVGQGLMKSIAESGINTPLTLMFYNKEALLLDGQRRWQAAKELGLPIVPVRMFPDDVELNSLFRIIFLENNGQQPFNAVEKALFFHNLQRFLGEKASAEWLPLMAVKPGRKSVQLLKDIAACDLGWQDFFIRKKVPLKRIRNILGSKAFPCLSDLRDRGIGLNKLEQIAVLLDECARIRSVDAGDLYSLITENDRKNEAAEGNLLEPDLILNKLRTIRYPALSRFHEKTLRRISELDLPGNIRVQMDPNYEKEGFSLQISILDKKELKNALKWLNDHETKLIELTKRDLEE